MITCPTSASCPTSTASSPPTPPSTGAAAWAWPLVPPRRSCTSTTRLLPASSTAISRPATCCLTPTSRRSSLILEGTLGYLAPEYAMWGKVSGACDVYSFGILLVELVSGRKPIERLPSGAKRTITEWAEPLIARGRLGDLVDPRLRGIYDAAELARMLEAAALCVQGEPERRPDMRAVVRILRGDAQVRPAVRMESVKYADHLMETENSVYSGDGDEDDQEDEKEAADYSSDEVEEYSLMDDQSSMNFGVFGAMPVVPVQTMHDPYV
uniref:Protein kinase domain-containing protein n=1 Tax=Aegilops tauschii subsp. strangulata TaxID=200361 RepID=A0A453T3E6_AEGTS